LRIVAREARVFAFDLSQPPHYRNNQRCRTVRSPDSLDMASDAPGHHHRNREVIVPMPDPRMKRRLLLGLALLALVALCLGLPGDALYRVALWQRDRGNPNAARRLCEALGAMPLSRRRAWARWQLGCLALESGDAGEAASWFGRAGQADPPPALTLRIALGIAEAARQQGDWEGADAAYRHFLTKYPGDGIAAQALERWVESAWQARGDVHRAGDILLKLAPRYLGSRTLSVLANRLIDAEVQEGDLRLAIQMAAAFSRPGSIYREEFKRKREFLEEHRDELPALGLLLAGEQRAMSSVSLAEPGQTTWLHDGSHDPPWGREGFATPLEELVRRYPQSRLVPHALYLLGRWSPVGHQDSRAPLRERLVSHYPDSPYAQMSAAELLASAQRDVRIGAKTHSLEFVPLCRRFLSQTSHGLRMVAFEALAAALAESHRAGTPNEPLQRLAEVHADPAAVSVLVQVELRDWKRVEAETGRYLARRPQSEYRPTIALMRAQALASSGRREEAALLARTVPAGPERSPRERIWLRSLSTARGHQSAGVAAANRPGAPLLPEQKDADGWALNALVLGHLRSRAGRQAVVRQFMHPPGIPADLPAHIRIGYVGYDPLKTRATVDFAFFFHPESFADSGHRLTAQWHDGRWRFAGAKRLWIS
jgi:tetratricopeptide (TPR) repeat protein